MIRAAVLALVVAASASAATSPIPPSTTNNDDSCDIALQPAATLLLPYFEVDFKTPATVRQTTYFSVVNTSPLPQIVRVTLWTDWSYPALTFPMFLTGYDEQLINLNDIFSTGTLAAQLRSGGSGTSSLTPVPRNPVAGAQPLPNDANPNFSTDVKANCASLPGPMDAALLAALRAMFTTGITGSCRVGGVHDHAIGYATIDVVANCGIDTPLSGPYYTSTLLYDNVLTGDYIDILPAGPFFSGDGGPLVHIRAIPEGGKAGSVVPAKLPYTFYARFSAGAPSDRRQPLPSAFVPRFVDDGADGLRTSLKIWRETVIAGSAGCASYALNSATPLGGAVRYDEHENATFLANHCEFCFAPNGTSDASLISSTSALLPPKSNSGDPAGWLELNLDAGGIRPTQSWVIASLSAPQHFNADIPAPSRGNGCTRPAAKKDDSCDIAVQPAATLLLPYFDVDFTRHDSTTLFTIQNVSPRPQIANVTLWTDWGFAAMSFPIVLSAHDVQSIDLFDVFARGVIAADAGHDFANPNFLPEAPAACTATSRTIPAAMLAELQRIFTNGQSSACSDAVGGGHTRAIGYATVDVVATCAPRSPASPDYVTTMLLYDNVLTGDYQQISSSRFQASGGSLVHIRAIPEGGPVGSLSATSLPYTFYDRFTAGLPTRTMDRRQPLPSAFASWVASTGSGGLNTSLLLWREGVSAGTCANAAANAHLAIKDVVRFDEHENATILAAAAKDTAAVASVPMTSTLLPPLSALNESPGWIYLNLDNGGSTAYSVAHTPEGAPRIFARGTTTVRQSQNWVIAAWITLPPQAPFPQDIFAAFDAPATALGNGCSPSPDLTTTAAIQPAENVTP